MSTSSTPRLLASRSRAVSVSVTSQNPTPKYAPVRRPTAMNRTWTISELNLSRRAEKFALTSGTVTETPIRKVLRVRWTRLFRPLRGNNVLAIRKASCSSDWFDKIPEESLYRLGWP